ncbi:hypothetical protein [Nocardia sp. CC201C]|uniref:hypothetical protein n=1 Tax=Nocardia sp. CC201C TaxID=3044575 RepID=UPI0024A90EDE|nr:hypothetical protein [Nocardia sp. CC201C]
MRAQRVGNSVAHRKFGGGHRRTCGTMFGMFRQLIIVSPAAAGAMTAALVVASAFDGARR